MDRQDLVIRPIGSAGLDAFIAYLEDQLKDNGQNGTPLFQPTSRHETRIAADRVASFRVGMETPVGEAKWRRVWCAFDPIGAIIGHVDLRAHQDPCTSHRASLGMGVHRDHRGRGIGRSLLDFVTGWALQNTALEWIDLGFLAGNTLAERLYRQAGFEDVATIRDRFRVDGQSIDNVIMTKRIRP
jgi:ribosomal protein S18 acetylase RimI-like enzyme